MDYMTTRQAAELWGVTIRQIQHFLKEERIPGAIQSARGRLIPLDAVKPFDRRRNNPGRPRKHPVGE